MDFTPATADVQNKKTLTGGGSGNIIIGSKTTSRSFIINYTLNRDALYEEGILRILHNGTTPQILRDEQDNGDIGVTFTVNMDGDNVRLGWVASAGNDVTMNYIIRKVDI